MRTLAFILVFSVIALAPRPAGAASEFTYVFFDSSIDHSTERGSGFSQPQLSSSDGYYTANGTITIVRGEANNEGSIPLDISELLNVGDPPKHQESYARITIYLRSDGSIDDRRQYDLLTGEEIALAHFLIPNLLQTPVTPQKTWTVGGVWDRVDDRTDYTLVATDPDGSALLTFEQRVKGAGGYLASGKLLYDATRRLPVKAHTELRSVDLNDTVYENIDFALQPQAH